MNLPAGYTVWRDINRDVYIFRYPDGTLVEVSPMDLLNMTPGMDPIAALGSGALNGRYRTPTQTTHSSSSYGAYSGDPRVQAHVTAQAQLLAAQQAALSQQTANYLSGGGLTYTSTSGLAGFANCTFTGLTPEPPPVIEYAGIKGGEIIAYRCWLIAGSILKGFALTSCFVETKWNPGEPMTGDVGSNDYCGLGYGVHSFKTKKLAFEYGQGYKFNLVALGRVKLWGEVVEHEKGYRAENAKIMSIDQILNPKDDQLILRKLRKRYGVNEYANGNDTDSRQVGPGDGEEAGEDQGFGRDDIPSVPGDSRKGGCWNYLRGLIQGRRV